METIKRISKIVQVALTELGAIVIALIGLLGIIKVNRGRQAKKDLVLANRIDIFM